MIPPKQLRNYTVELEVETTDYTMGEVTKLLESAMKDLTMLGHPTITIRRITA